MEARFRGSLDFAKIQIYGLGMRTKLFIRIVLAVWVVIWALFLVRPYFKNKLFNEYAALARLSPDDKRAYVTGRQLYEFIKFCNGRTGAPSTYKIIGLEKDPLDYRRAVYYLYPNTDSASPEFLFVYKVKGYSDSGYDLFAALDDERYILKRRGR